MSSLYNLDSTGVKFKQILSANNKVEFLNSFFSNLLLWGSCLNDSGFFKSKNNLYNDFVLLAFEKLNDSIESLNGLLELKYSNSHNEVIEIARKINSFLKLFNELFIKLHKIESSNLFIVEDTKNIIKYSMQEDEQVDNQKIVGGVRLSNSIEIKNSVSIFKKLQNENGILIPLLCGHNGVYSDSEIQGLLECLTKVKFCH